MRKAVMVLFALVIAHDLAVAQVELRGLALSLRAHGVSWKLDEFENLEFASHQGAGAGAEVFYGMSDIFGVFGRIDLSSVSPDEGESYTLTHFDVGVRLLPRLASRALRPYAELAFTARSADFDVGTSTLEVSGSAATVGAGLLMFVSPRLALGFSAAGSFGSMEEVSLGGFTVDANIKATSWRGAAGLVWFP